MTPTHRAEQISVAHLKNLRDELTGSKAMGVRIEVRPMIAELEQAIVSAIVQVERETWREFNQLLANAGLKIIDKGLAGGKQIIEAPELKASRAAGGGDG